MARYTDDIERHAVAGDGALLEWATKLGDQFVDMEVKHFDTLRYEGPGAGCGRNMADKQSPNVGARPAGRSMSSPWAKGAKEEKWNRG